MNWYRLIGVDDKVLANVDPQHNERQSYILSMIGIMITVIPIICFLSSIVLAAPVFQSWIVGIFIGIFLSLVVFNLYRLFVMTALDVSGTALEDYHSHHEKHFDANIDIHQDFSKLSDIELIKIAKDSIIKLRKKTSMDAGHSKITFEHLLTMAFRVIILSIIAIIFASGIELFLFKNQINNIILEVINLYKTQNNTEALKYYFDNNGEGLLFKSNSILFLMQILIKGLGIWKFVIDIIIIIIFLIPLAIIFKSMELKKSEYVQELALYEIETTFLHHLRTQKLCSELNKQLAIEFNYDFLKES
jgi:hypothetical protein